MKKAVKVVLIILTVAILLMGGAVFLLYQMARSMGIGSGQVADHETRVNVWNTVPGNSSRSKPDDMNIDYGKKDTLFATLKFAGAIVNSKYSDEESVIDTFTYLYEIKGGYEKETYEDEPYLIPYVAEDSDSAFVLHYRTNPYEYPIPYLDVQRAVRYLRYHAETYHLDPDKISLIGSSAGGNAIGTFINTLQGRNLFPADYTPDEIDMADDSVASAAMIYPALSFRYNVPILFCMFDEEDVRDEAKREAVSASMRKWQGTMTGTGLQRMSGKPRKKFLIN